MLRWALVLLCTIWSATYGTDVLSISVTLSITTMFYDELGMAAHPIGKNICCVLGYASFEFGATMLAGPTRRLDSLSLSAIIMSGTLILTTIQAQDFADVEGDTAIGRVTLPILFPELSRVFTSSALVSWSIILGWYWRVGVATKTIFLGLGAYTGWRIYSKRSAADDKGSYIIFNLWLMIAHALSLHFRKDLFRF